MIAPVNSPSYRRSTLAAIQSQSCNSKKVQQTKQQWFIVNVVVSPSGCSSALLTFPRGQTNLCRPSDHQHSPPIMLMEICPRTQNKSQLQKKKNEIRREKGKLVLCVQRKPESHFRSVNEVVAVQEAAHCQPAQHDVSNQTIYIHTYLCFCFSLRLM